MTSGIAVIVTARDEAERIVETLTGLRLAFPSARLLVADDGSTDATARLAAAARAEVVSTGGRLGKGGAATLAARRLLAPGCDRPGTVVLCDGDLGASASELAALVAAIERREGDLAVAVFDRREGGGFGLALSAARRAIGDLTGLVPAAPLSGQRAMRSEVLAAVLPFARGFGMECAMTIDAHRAGFALVEVALPLAHRATGRTAAGFIHRGRQLADVAVAWFWRRRHRGR